MRIGVFPVRDHYYEPQFDFRKARQPFSMDRRLPGIDWNIAEQLEILATLSFAHELADVPLDKPSANGFFLSNETFGPGDAEYWYQIIRKFKPKRIYEVGSGNSTLMAIRAIQFNRREDSGYNCKHVCIEPYEMPWLEATGVQVIRRRIEDLDLAMFAELEENDVLFIDSSHMIRPQGDVLVECLELLPTLKKGVVVHFHDIFSPRNYPRQWLEDMVRLWNEQYLLEAFLSHNRDWKIIGALNHLHHRHHEKLKAVAPFLIPDREPGSFYIRKVSG